MFRLSVKCDRALYTLADKASKDVLLRRQSPKKLARDRTVYCLPLNSTVIPNQSQSSSIKKKSFLYI